MLSYGRLVGGVRSLAVVRRGAISSCPEGVLGLLVAADVPELVGETVLADPEDGDVRGVDLAAVSAARGQAEKAEDVAVAAEPRLGPGPVGATGDLGAAAHQFPPRPGPLGVGRP